MPIELVFKVTQEGDGGFVAECLSHCIVTQGDSAEELQANVAEAVTAYFFDQPKPSDFSLEALADMQAFPSSRWLNQMSCHVGLKVHHRLDP